MKNLILALITYGLLIAIGRIVESLGLPVEWRISFVLIATLVFVILVTKLTRSMTKLENGIFTTVLIASLTVSWLKRDVERGVISPFTVAVALIFVGSLTSLLMKRKEVS
jgi:hypothetical protein